MRERGTGRQPRQECPPRLLTWTLLSVLSLPSLSLVENNKSDMPSCVRPWGLTVKSISPCPLSQVP